VSVAETSSDYHAVVAEVDAGDDVCCVRPQREQLLISLVADVSECHDVGTIAEFS